MTIYKRNSTKKIVFCLYIIEETCFETLLDLSSGVLFILGTYCDEVRPIACKTHEVQ